MRNRVLNHIGIIPDGTRRWAKENNYKNLFDAYVFSMEKLSSVINHIFDQDIHTISVYMLSKENLRRSEDELAAVFEAETKFILEMLPNIAKKWQLAILPVGRIDLISETYRNALEEIIQNSTEQASKKSRKLYLLIAYNPIDEIHHALGAANGAEELMKHLWVPESVDIIIRSGFGKLLSNFLPIQSGYAELVFLNKYFNDIELDEISVSIVKYRSSKEGLYGT